MEEIIKRIFDLEKEYGICISKIKIIPKIGNAYISITLSKKDRAITRLFYYVPVSDNYISFKHYNRYFDIEFEKMIQELNGKQ